MRKAVRWPVLLGSVLVGAAGLAGWTGRAAAQAEDAERPPVLKKLGILVGGKWVTEAKNAEGLPFAELRFTWSEDGRTLIGRGVIGQGTPKPVRSEARFGWDPAAKKVYYLDLHGPETIYFGHVTQDGEDLIYEFKTLTGPPQTWRSRESYPDSNTCKAVMAQIVDGKETRAHRINLKRVSDSPAAGAR